MQFVCCFLRSQKELNILFCCPRGPDKKKLFPKTEKEYCKTNFKWNFFKNDNETTIVSILLHTNYYFKTNKVFNEV